MATACPQWPRSSRSDKRGAYTMHRVRGLCENGSNLDYVPLKIKLPVSLMELASSFIWLQTTNNTIAFVGCAASVEPIVQKSFRLCSWPYNLDKKP